MRKTGYLEAHSAAQNESITLSHSEPSGRERPTARLQRWEGYCRIVRRRKDEEQLVQGLMDKIGRYTRRGAIVCSECHRWAAEERAEADGWQYRTVGFGTPQSQLEQRAAICPECASRKYGLEPTSEHD